MNRNDFPSLKWPNWFFYNLQRGKVPLILNGNMSEWISRDFCKKRQPMSEARECLLYTSNTSQPFCDEVSGEAKTAKSLYFVDYIKCIILRKSGPHTANILVKYHRFFNKKKSDQFCIMKLEADKIKNEVKCLKQKKCFTTHSNVIQRGLFIHLPDCIWAWQKSSTLGNWVSWPLFCSVYTG